MKPSSKVYLLSLVHFLTVTSNAWADDDVTADLNTVIGALREKHQLPALGAAIVREDGSADVAVVGVRKIGSDVAATVDDQFHLGSCTKAMTATLAAMLVEQGKLRWDTTIAEGLPDLAKAVRPEYREVTLTQLLSHWAGLPPSERTWPEGLTIDDVRKLGSDPRTQRAEYVRRILSQPPETKPGTKFTYSNAGYSVAGAIIERALDQSWEEAMQKRIFNPLGMKSAGFGAMGIEGHKNGRVDQPWQHVWDGKKHTPVEPTKTADNPPAIWPGGGVHCSLADWARFVSVFLLNRRVHAANKPLISAASLATLQSPTFGGDYALGWGARQNDSLGKILSHAGSNTMNYCVARVVPERKQAILVVTNQGGGETDKAVMEAVELLTAKFLNHR